MPDFVPGLDLSRAFYAEAVRPILASQFPDLVYAAALIGYGSDVLGYDTPRSTDHEWGPRLLLFLPDEVAPSLGDAIEDALRAALPVEFMGYSTSFGPKDAQGVRLRVLGEPGHITHHVDIWTLGAFTLMELGVDPDQALLAGDWLALPEQKLLQVTSGAVFHDGLGTLTALRERLAYYPHDVWLYLMAAQWMRVAQTEAFVGRTAEAGDDLGARLITAALVRDLMRLSFQQARHYAPYSKWFGSAFAGLPVADVLGPVLRRALAADNGHEQEDALVSAYAIVGEQHNALGITPPLDTAPSLFYDRPYRVLAAGRFVEALARAIEGDEVKDVMKTVGYIGAIDQITDSTDVLTHPRIFHRMQALYKEG
ncbi:MAG: hypothetical protein OJF49_000668 [Ktedonobacterales bacterium]|jgi:hypothetical protein|nr:MAG: hypothetical protein OJF49_000668 [Ktedonobacterales bacterium]